MKLFFRQWGEANKDILIFLHGMGGTGSLWRPVAAMLEDQYAIIAPDQRGHGASRPVPGQSPQNPRPSFTPLDYGRDVLETLDDLGIEKFWLIGHSMGVRTSIAIAHLAPERVKGMCLIDIGFSGPAGGGLGQSLADFLRILPESFPDRASARTFMDQHCPDPSIAQYLMAVSQVQVGGQVGFPFDHSSLIETIQSSIQISAMNWMKAYGEAGKPALVLRGANSRVYSAESYEQEKKELQEFPSIIFETFENTGHGLPFERRKDFCERLKDWIESSASFTLPESL